LPKARRNSAVRATALSDRRVRPAVHAERHVERQPLGRAVETRHAAGEGGGAGEIDGKAVDAVLHRAQDLDAFGAAGADVGADPLAEQGAVVEAPPTELGRVERARKIKAPADVVRPHEFGHLDGRRRLGLRAPGGG
jgi:hypothetical protein